MVWSTPLRTVFRNMCIVPRDGQPDATGCHAPKPRKAKQIMLGYIHKDLVFENTTFSLLSASCRKFLVSIGRVVLHAVFFFL